MPSDSPRPPEAAAPKRGLPWRFAGFLATSRLSTDSLGSVFRALPPSEKPDGFVRLRLFDGPDLPRDRVASLLHRATSSNPASPVLVQNARLGAHDGTGWLAWNESHGQSLDRLLSGRSGQGHRFPPEHALLIADRLALALEHASGRGRASHGLLWPGFVILGSAGEVRLGGFGVATAVLPFLSAPSLSAEIAPYLAPETREGEPGGELADVYSVGAILLHLLSGRPAPARAAADAVGPAELYPAGMAELLRLALAPAPRRIERASLLRRRIGAALVASGLQPSSRALAAFAASRLEAETVCGEPLPSGDASASAADEDWELAISRLEPGVDAVRRPRPRSGRPARVPLPPALSPGLPGPARTLPPR
ncbi:MAG: hypothetical protein LC796_11635 [Acidobacteria bacterium]|nr:hypothetical protein [Acidobacteriota bacterium]MCA1617477.1 hypothetical protein [Acidobacteriota bacterium]